MSEGGKIMSVLVQGLTFQVWEDFTFL